MLFGEHTNTPKFIVFVPPLEIFVHETKAPIAIVRGMTLTWEMHATKLEAVYRRPVFGQLHGNILHPHMSGPNVFSEHFCMGDNKKAIDVAEKYGDAADIISTAIATMRDYYAGSSYRRALSTMPMEATGLACACNGGDVVCDGCREDAICKVTDAGYKNSKSVVPCTGCGGVVVGDTVWVQGVPYCDSCAVWYSGVGYLISECDMAAVMGGKKFLPKGVTVPCSVCREKNNVERVHVNYPRVCPRTDCGARNQS